MDQANGRTEGWDTGAVSVVFCSDERLLEVNNKYLNHNYFTDIITFDYSDPEKKKIAGDLMIGTVPCAITRPLSERRSKTNCSA